MGETRYWYPMGTIMTCQFPKPAATHFAHYPALTTADPSASRSFVRGTGEVDTIKPVDVVLVGTSGYGGYYIDQFREGPDMGATIRAVVDPFASASPHLPWLRERSIPVFDRLEDFYGSGGRAELVVISSPIQFHHGQAKTAMERGAAVLCEKPLCACAADAVALREIQERTGVPFGVGFQWSFSLTMEALKHNILAGTFGKPIALKTIVSWPRGDAYFDPRGWKGKRRDKDGEAINDSIAMNATAHYLHNMLFLLGAEMDSAACPETVSGSLYRARNIETFDTCFLRGSFADGCTLLFCASHVAEKRIDPQFEYRFEKGIVFFDENADGVVRAVFRDQSVKAYGQPQSDAEIRRKLLVMVDAARTGKRPVCGISTALPHLRVCDALLRWMDIAAFPRELIRTRTAEPSGLYVKGLDKAMESFYRTGEPPDGSSASWAARERAVQI